MHPIVFERDIQLVDFAAALELNAFSTTTSGINADNIYMVSDGILKNDYAAFKGDNLVTLTTGVGVSAGIHISPPREDSGEFTPYAYNVTAWTEDPEITPMFFTAVSPATITANATGDIVEDIRHLAVGVSAGGFNAMNACGVVGVASPPTADRNLAFGVTFACGLSSATASSGCYYRMDVRRLVKHEPKILDHRKIF